ncbi:MAG: lipopolysaccharide heptosyltransferase II [Phycisphaerae bacterium]|nr:lipopolysaccharide heptosyltransferase II [Phycisphaerae bacterium]
MTGAPTPERVLVVLPSWVGDATMATPALRAIREAWPAARITHLARPGIDAVLAGLPWADAVVVDRLGGLLGPFRGAARLRRDRFDAAILLPNSFRTALAVRLAGIPRRIGYARDGRSWLLTQAIAPTTARPASTVDWYCDLVERALGVAIADRAPSLAVAEADVAAASAARAALPGRYALFVPGGNRLDKRWPAERFARVAEHLAARHGLLVAATGSPGERPVIEAIAKASGVPIVDCSAFPGGLSGLKCLVRDASLVVTNDTGPRHFAAAFRVPTVALFGPTDHRWTVLRGVPERLLVAEPFLPEELVADDRAAFCAMDRIAVGDVVARCDELLATASR